MRKLVVSQFIILLVGTVFAWTNFGLEMASYLGRVVYSSCPAARGSVNPFFTPCFYGATLFLVAFILSALMLRKTSEK